MNCKQECRRGKTSCSKDYSASVPICGDGIYPDGHSMEACLAAGKQTSRKNFRRVQDVWASWPYHKTDSELFFSQIGATVQHGTKNQAVPGITMLSPVNELTQKMKCYWLEKGKKIIQFWKKQKGKGTNFSKEFWMNYQSCTHQSNNQTLVLVI